METVMVTLATMALNEIIKGGAGELGKGLAGGTLAKVNKLGEMIWSRIKGKPGIEAAIPKLEQGDPKTITKVQGQIDEVLQDEKSTFVQEVKQLAAEIHQEIQSEVKAKNVQPIFGGQGLQVNDPQAPVIQAKDSPITFNYNN